MRNHKPPYPQLPYPWCSGLTLEKHISTNSKTGFPLIVTQETKPAMIHFQRMLSINQEFFFYLASYFNEVIFEASVTHDAETALQHSVEYFENNNIFKYPKCDGKNWY